MTTEERNQNLRTLVARLAIGFVIILIIGFVLFQRLKGTKPVPVVSSPTPQTTGTPSVVIVTPTPTPNLPSLPEVASNSGSSSSKPTPHAVGRVVPNRTLPRTTIQQITIMPQNTVSASASATASPNGQTFVSTSTNSDDGSAYASASASSAASQ